MNGVVEKINNERKKTCCGLIQKQLKTWGEIMPQANAWISGDNEEMQNSTSKEYGELIALQDARTKDTWTPPTRILMNSWKNELKHEEPPWRTPVTKGWRDKNEGWKNRWALRWFKWRFRRNGRGNLNSGKEKDENTWN